MTELAQALSSALLRFLWQGTLAAAGCAAVLALLRRSSANARYLAACCGLAVMAAIPVIVGLTGDAYQSAKLFIGPFHDAMWICVGLMIAGGLLSAFTISNDQHEGADHKIPMCTVCPGAHPPVGVSPRPSGDASISSGAAP